MSVKDRVADLEKKLEVHKAYVLMQLRFLGNIKVDLSERLNKLEALEARVESQRDYDDLDTKFELLNERLNKLSIPASKPEKFIKVVDDKSERHLLRFNNIDSIKSYWGKDSTNGYITFILGDLWVIKSYSDKEAWQHDLNKIEWFIYDDALLLDLTDLVAPDMGVHWNPPSNHHNICPICKERLVYYAKEDTYNCYIPTTGMGTIAGRMCTQCNYKES